MILDCIYVHYKNKSVCERNIVSKIEFCTSANCNATAVAHLSTLGTNSRSLLSERFWYFGYV